MGSVVDDEVMATMNCSRLGTEVKWGFGSIAISHEEALGTTGK